MVQGEDEEAPSLEPVAPPVPSPLRKTRVLKAPVATKSSPQQKQATASRRRKALDKKYIQENGIITVPGELTKIVPCEAFFMPVSKKRQLLIEVNNVSTTNQGTQPSIEEGSKDVSIQEGGVPNRNAGKPIHPLFSRTKTSAFKVAPSKFGYLEPSPPSHVTQCSERMEARWEDSIVHPSSPIECFNEEELVLRLMQNGHSLKGLLMSRVSISTQNKMETCSKSSAPQFSNSGGKLSDVYQASSSQLQLEQRLENLLEYLQKSTEPTRKLFGAYLQPLPGGEMENSTSTEKLKERFSWYKACHDSCLSDEDKGALNSKKNILWTDLYKPKSSKEVCGNATGVEFLNNWLKTRRERMMGQVNGLDLSQRNTAARQHDSDSDRGWFEGDSDIDIDGDEESGLHSTILVTGPTGCGKTAAVYACAAEQGFTVIEVNASSGRSGASLMQKFGSGGLESHAVGQWPAVEDQASSAKEGDGSRTLLYTTSNVTPPNRRKSKKGSQTRSDNDSKPSVSKSAVGRKLFDSRALNDCEENLGVSVDEPQPGSPQKKKMTVILFEDVDVQFEEDRGFVKSLVRLAKTTKRPIILTSNSRQPGLSQILQKARIDFCYPSPEELTLHAYMVSIAEGVAGSPWMVNRLVESCQCDIRKVLMSLQFWKQDTCSELISSLNSKSPDSKTSNNIQNISERSLSENCRGSRRRLSLRPALPDPIVNKLLASEKASAFIEWDSEARYLYDLDIHHIILPHVFSRNCPSLLSLEVVTRINAAVSELEKHESMVAVKDAEQQVLALQAQLNSVVAERKAQRRAKDDMRKASRTKLKLVEEEVAVCGNLSSNNDTVGEWMKSQLPRTPVKSLREARAFARSPLKVRSTRGVLLYSSDNDEGQATQRQVDNNESDCLSGVSNPYTGRIQVAEVQDTDETTPATVVISSDMEDKDVMSIASCESVATVRRKRLQKAFESDIAGPRMLSKIGVFFRKEIENEEVNLMAVTCTKDIESSSQILSSPPELEAEMDEKLLPDERHSVTGSTQRDKTGEHRTCLETNNLETRESELNAEKAAQTELNVTPCPGDENVVEYNHAKNANIRNHEDRQLCNAVGIFSRLVDSTEIRSSGDNHCLGLESDVQNVPGGEKSGCSEMEVSMSRSSLCEVQHSRDVWDDTTNAGVLETRCEFVNPVQKAWEALGHERQALQHLLRPLHSSIYESDALATVLDVISDSNTISSFSSETRKIARITFSGTWNGVFEGNIGHCSFWESCQEMASQLVRTALQTLATASLVTSRDNSLPIALSILSAAKDVPAVGKIISCDGVKSKHNLASRLTSTESTCSRKESRRQSERQERLYEIIRTRLLPKGRMVGVSLLDYIAYLAVINQREEERRTQTINDSRRPRRFQHHLSSKMSEADIAELGVLCRFAKA